MTNLGDDLYTGASGAGKIWTLISAVIATIVCLLMVATGIYIIYHKNYLKYIESRVLKSSYNCSISTPSNTSSNTSSNTPSNTPSNQITTCKFDTRYTVNNQNYTKTFSSSNTYQVDDKVTVWYDPNHPDRSEFNPLSKTVGWFIIALSFLILFGAWFMVWLSRRSKFIAASIGAGAGIGIAKSAVNMF